MKIRVLLVALLLTASAVCADPLPLFRPGWLDSSGNIKGLTATDSALPVNINASGAVTALPAVWTTYTCSALTITNVSQNVASMADRVFCMVQNLSTTDSIWINPGAVSAASGSGNIEILPGQYWMDYVGPAVNIPIIADSSTAATVVQGK